jgi:hypothetical protein
MLRNYTPAGLGLTFRRPRNLLRIARDWQESVDGLSRLRIPYGHTADRPDDGPSSVGCRSACGIRLQRVGQRADR